MSSANALRYLTGFNNEHATEAIPGALPVGQNSPQVAPLGLYAEQLSGTAFTAPRHMNRRTWFYRIRPGVDQRLDAVPVNRPGVARQVIALHPSLLAAPIDALPEPDERGERSAVRTDPRA